MSGLFSIPLRLEVLSVNLYDEILHSNDVDAVGTEGMEQTI
jgi:hypothetical protein